MPWLQASNPSRTRALSKFRKVPFGLCRYPELKFNSMALIFLLLTMISPAQSQEDPKDLQAVFETTAGTFTIQFYRRRSPEPCPQISRARATGILQRHFFPQHGGARRHSRRRSGDQKSAALDKYGSGGFNMGLKPEIGDLPLKRGTLVAFTLPGTGQRRARSFSSASRTSCSSMDNSRRLPLLRTASTLSKRSR